MAGTAGTAGRAGWAAARALTALTTMRAGAGGGRAGAPCGRQGCATSEIGLTCSRRARGAERAQRAPKRAFGGGCGQRGQRRFRQRGSSGAAGRRRRAGRASRSLMPTPPAGILAMLSHSPRPPACRQHAASMKAEATSPVSTHNHAKRPRPAVLAMGGGSVRGSPSQSQSSMRHAAPEDRPGPLYAPSSPRPAVAALPAPVPAEPALACPGAGCSCSAGRAAARHWSRQHLFLILTPVLCLPARCHRPQAPAASWRAPICAPAASNRRCKSRLRLLAGARGVGARRHHPAAASVAASDATRFRPGGAAACCPTGPLNVNDTPGPR